MMKLEYKIKLNDNYNNISDVLKKHFNVSTRLFKKLILENSIYINNFKYVHKDYINKNFDVDDLITIDLDYLEDSSNIVAKQMELEIIYEDDWLLVLNKPAGIPVHPSMNHFENSLSNGVKYYFDLIGLNKKIRPVNRLDKDTSGLVIFAKCEYIHSIFMNQMQEKTFTKKYLTIVDGIFDAKKGTIDFPIGRKDNSIIERCVRSDGQNSITKYIVLKENKQLNLSLLECKLVTGRTHQIRVHMSHIGHPILGDTLYGSKSEKINRQALHSYYIKCIHPVFKKDLEFKCGLPKDMELI